MSLRTRIALAFLVINTLGVIYFLHSVLGDLKPRYREAVEESLVDTANILASLVGERSKDGALEVRSFSQAIAHALESNIDATIYEFHKEKVELSFYVTNDMGVVIFDSTHPENVGRDFSQWNDVKRTLRGEYGARATRDVTGDPTSTVLYVAAPIKAGGKTIGVLSVGKPTGNLNALIQRSRQKLILVSALIIAAELLLIYLISLSVTLPLARLRRYADDVRQGKRAFPPKRGSPEIKELGQALEAMRVELEGKEYVERYVQTLTHELKSPLAAIKASAEILADNPQPQDRERFVQSIESETLRAQQAIDALLELSALERLKELPSSDAVSVDEIISAAVAQMTPVFERQKLQVESSLPPSCSVAGNRDLLIRVFENLLKNAAEFSRQESRIIISGTVSKGLLTIELRDFGAGIPEFALDKLFERFYSLPRPNGKKSSGIGLAIVKEILDLHQGTIQITNAPSGGALASVTLPLATPR